MSKTDQKMIFTRMARVRGALYSSYCFTSEKKLKEWIKSEFPLLEKQYGALELTVSKLPGFKVGDTCFVWGEGSDTFTIEGIKQYSPHRFGFLLDSGCSEEVVKCHNGKNYPITYLKKLERTLP